MRSSLTDVGIGANVVLDIDDEATLAAVSRQLAEQARIRLRIRTPDLEPRVYDNAAFVEAVRALALRSARTDIRILLHDTDAAIKRGHRLIDLARRLTSRLEIRALRPPPGVPDDAFLLADGRALIHRPNAERTAATVRCNAPRDVRLLENRFQALWHDAETAADLRRLHL